MNYFDFSIHQNGRLRRSVFWRSMVLLTVLSVVMDLYATEHITNHENYIRFSIIVYVIFLPFELSLIARRFQDAGYSVELKRTFMGLSIVLGFLGAIVDFEAEDTEWLGLLSIGYFVALIICGSKDSQPGSNMWGDNPKGVQLQSPPDGAGVGGASAGASGASQVCPCCSGGGRNAAGYVCPHCGGTGMTSRNMH